jgi:hypothetical protein
MMEAEEAEAETRAELVVATEGAEEDSTRTCADFL